MEATEAPTLPEVPDAISLGNDENIIVWLKMKGSILNATARNFLTTITKACNTSLADIAIVMLQAMIWIPETKEELGTMFFVDVWCWSRDIKPVCHSQFQVQPHIWQAFRWLWNHRHPN